MPDHPPDHPPDDPSGHPPDLTPAETERVRRLLASARHTEPVPADVAARLDRTLAELTAQDRELRTLPAVSTLESRRRRRRATRLLVAAVAVVAVGVGAGPVLSGLGGGSDGDAGSSSESTADRRAGAAGGDGSPEGQPAPAETPGGAAADGEGDHQRDTPALPRVGAATFASDAEAVRASGVLRGDAPTGSLGLDHCGEDAGPGQRAVVRYAGRPAVLVYRAPEADGQRVDLYRCGSDALLRSAVLGVP